MMYSSKIQKKVEILQDRSLFILGGQNVIISQNISSLIYFLKEKIL